ncbi:MAG TPA: polymorphic toxin type 23 domain-containing protein [Bacteroidia bacterium]|jgi:hypothetical protein|nr:polymorphic toxin type 23 domain-containing protein [Bacteroidia bacterium]
MKKFRLFILCFSFLFLWCRGAMAQQPFFGGSAGVVAALGTKFDRIGLFVRGYVACGQFQLNGDMRVYWNFKNLGPRKRYLEETISIGAVYAYWKKDTIHSTHLLTDVSNQTGWSNSAGYGHTFYFNRIGTAQQTGTFSLQFNRVDFITENDILGHTFYDRFRTGAMVLQYLVNSNLQLGLNCTMWTGQMEHRVRPADYPSPNGYMDTTGAKFYNCSAGLLSVQANAVLPYYQQAEASAGIDAEQVRNVVQNKVIHDLVFLPRKWRTDRNAHMPMLDDKGEQYLFKPGQRIKKPSTYINGYLNPGLFY